MNKHKSAYSFLNRRFQSFVFNSGQKMARRAFDFINQGVWTYYYIRRCQRYLLANFENNRFVAPRVLIQEKLSVSKFFRNTSFLFTDMYKSMTLDTDCLDPDNNIVVNDLTNTNTILLRKAVTASIKAECIRKVDLKRTFLDIDAFYKFSPENVQDFCSSPNRAQTVIETKLRSLTDALRKSDDIVTNMFEDLSRTPNSVTKPLPFSYGVALENTRKTLLQEFQSRINAQVLNQLCPKPDASSQLDIITQSRPTRPSGSQTTPLARISTTTTTTATTTTTTTTTTATTAPTTTTTGRVNQFLLNAFNLRNG